MEFFCTQCQKRHPVEDIAADMWSICKADILTGLTGLVWRMQEELGQKLSEEISDLRDILISFINKVDNVEDMADMKTFEEN